MGKATGSAPAGNTTVTSNQSPWAGQAPFLSDLYSRAGNVSNIPLQYFPGQTVAQFNPTQTQALGAQSSLGLNDPIMQGATQGISPYLSGQMLSAGNPYFGNMVNQIGQAIQPSIDSHFNMNGRAGSGANNQAFASALANTAGGLAYQNFNDQSTNQLKAFLEAPGLSQGNFADIQQALSSGGAQQNQQQANINAAMQRFQFGQDEPSMRLARYQSLLGNTVPGSQTTTQPYFNNAVGGGLGALSTLFGGSGLTGQGPSLASNIYSGASNLGGSLGSGASSLWSNLFGSGGGGGAGADLFTQYATG